MEFAQSAEKSYTVAHAMEVFKMKLNKLLELINKHNINDNVLLRSDSGWECDATDMDGVYYNRKLNVIVFTQYISENDSYFNELDWEML